MSTLSPTIIPFVRAALAAQGYPPAIVKSDGTFDLSLASASTYETVEFRTEGTPPITLNISELLKPGPPHPFVRALKPTVVLRGPAGVKVIAPYGEASRDGGWRGAAVVLGLGLGVFFLGRVSR